MLRAGTHPRRARTIDPHAASMVERPQVVSGARLVHGRVGVQLSPGVVAQAEGPAILKVGCAVAPAPDELQGSQPLSGTHACPDCMGRHVEGVLLLLLQQQAGGRIACLPACCSAIRRRTW